MSGIGWECNVHLQVTVADDSVVQVYARKIVVRCISGADELFDDESARPSIVNCFWQTDRFSNVWDVHASIAFAREVHPPVFHAEKLDEVLPESDELCSQLIYSLDVWFALRKANAERLIDPDDVCQIEPGEQVWRWFVHSRKPIDGTIFGEQAFH